MNAPPIPCEWDGEVFRPIRHMQRICDRHFVVGEEYRLVEHHDRSDATHRHQFAEIHEAWKTLPEHLADLYPTSEHLRKRALIEAKFYDEEILDVGSKAGALRVAAFARQHDDFALVIVRGPIVVIRTAKSQSRRAMDKAEFQASKQAVLDIVSGLIGVDDPAELAPSPSNPSRQRETA